MYKIMNKNLNSAIKLVLYGGFMTDRQYWNIKWVCRPNYDARGTPWMHLVLAGVVMFVLSHGWPHI